MVKHVKKKSLPHEIDLGYPAMETCHGETSSETRPVVIDPKLLWSSCGKPLPLWPRSDFMTWAAWWKEFPIYIYIYTIVYIYIICICICICICIYIYICMYDIYRTSCKFQMLLAGFVYSFVFFIVAFYKKSESNWQGSIGQPSLTRRPLRPKPKKWARWKWRRLTQLDPNWLGLYST